MNSEPPLLIFQRSLNQWFLKAAEIGAHSQGAGGEDHRPSPQVAFSLGWSHQRPCFWKDRWWWHEDQKMYRILQRLDVRCGTLVCPGGSPYCWYEISRSTTALAVLLL